MADGPCRTGPVAAEVAAFLDSVAQPVRRRDAERLVALLAEVTGQEPRMWGRSIVGFGVYHYRYASGREGDMAAASFSPRKDATVLYLMDGVDVHAELLDRLGPHRLGTGCVYLKDLDDVDLDVLAEIVRRSYATLTAGDAFGRRLSGPHASSA